MGVPLSVNAQIRNGAQKYQKEGRGQRQNADFMKGLKKMDDLELAKELRRLAAKEDNFYTIHILNAAARRLEEKDCKNDQEEIE